MCGCIIHRNPGYVQKLSITEHILDHVKHPDHRKFNGHFSEARPGFIEADEVEQEIYQKIISFTCFCKTEILRQNSCIFWCSKANNTQ